MVMAVRIVHQSTDICVSNSGVYTNWLLRFHLFQNFAFCLFDPEIWCVANGLITILKMRFVRLMTSFFSVFNNLTS